MHSPCILSDGGRSALPWGETSVFFSIPRNRGARQKENPERLHAQDFGGSWWIRTTEALRSRFTVCPHWPLGKAPLFSFLAARASHLRVLVYYSKGIRKLQAFLKNFFFVVSSFAKLHANFFEISAWIRFFAMRQVLPNTWPKGLDLE